MKTAHTVITLVLALVFLISGLSKASGSSAGLSGTRDVGFPDGPARLVGIFEILASLSLILGFAFDNATLEQYGYVAILALMAGAIFFHFRANKMRTAFPAMLFLILSTIGIFTSKL
jgi:uncharacterized membrane protein YphA (DoxX/SURF4 family)